jgi:hypothetical protein
MVRVSGSEDRLGDPRLHRFSGDGGRYFLKQRSAIATLIVVAIATGWSPFQPFRLVSTTALRGCQLNDMFEREVSFGDPHKPKTVYESSDAWDNLSPLVGYSRKDRYRAARCRMDTSGNEF